MWGETYFGSVCKRGHDNGKGQSIRRVKDGKCVECSRLSRVDRQQFDLTRQPVRAGSYLGRLCPRNHDHDGTGKSLRYRCGDCIQCNAIRSRKQRAAKSLGQPPAYSGVSVHRNAVAVRPSLDVTSEDLSDLWDRTMADYPAEDFTDEHGEELWLGSLCPKPGHQYRASSGSLRRCEDNRCAACLRDAEQRFQARQRRAKSMGATNHV